MSYRLTSNDHSRDSSGLSYVYPVLSRRAGGLSIGINFNTNNACNWRCVYCQVPDLVRGSAPKLDFQLLEEELRFFLNSVDNGDFFEQFEVAKGQRVIKDIAISGNGEPTSLKGFAKAVRLIGRIAEEQGVLPASNFVLITNGSLMHQPAVQQGLKALNDYQGQVWFKLDSATEAGRRAINTTRQTTKKMLENLQQSSFLCETRVQTCSIKFLSSQQMAAEQAAYLELLTKIKQSPIKVDKIMLYTLARKSLQPEAKQIKKQEYEAMVLLANKLEDLGYTVELSG